MNVISKVSMIVGFSMILTSCQLEQAFSRELKENETGQEVDSGAEEETNQQSSRNDDVEKEDESDDGDAESLPDRAFQPDFKHKDVGMVQEHLNKLGYQVDVNNVYDIETQRAIYHFQKEQNHVSTDGIYDPETRIALEEAEQRETDIDTDGDEEQLPSEQKQQEDTPSDEVAIFDHVAEEALFEAMVLVGSTLNVRQEPDAKAEQVGQFNNGAHIFVLEEEGNWTYVSSEDVRGWVHASYIKEIPYDSTQKQTVDHPDDRLVLVNKQHKLPKDYEPEDLIIPDVPFPFEGTPERKYMRKEAGQALEELFEASQQGGLDLYATSGYRSFSTQKDIFPRNVKQKGFETANQTSAFPSESEHQTGLAMDVTNAEVNFSLTTSFGETKEGLWVKENAHKFGYIVRYQEGKEDITGYTYEPWHLRYVGKKEAKEIYEQDVTLEEYLE